MRTRLGVLGILLLWGLASVAGASLTQDLAKAAEKQKIAFVLVSEPAASNVADARDLIRSAMKQVQESTLFELDRSDPANADLVAQYRLAGAPIPLILVIARNGTLGGGIIAAGGTVERLVAMVPSPKKAEIMQYLQSGKAVFIEVSRKGMRGQGAALAACTAACGQGGGTSVVVAVDMDDPAEVPFLSSLKIDLAATDPVVLVVNAQGQVTGNYTGTVAAADLAQAATKKATGCCPSTVAGGSQSCAPPKK
jgi:hypothetical protein